MGLSEIKKKSIELAAEAVKQVLTLTTGTLALTVTFVKDLGAEGPSLALLIASWVALALSMLLGVFALGGLTGSVSQSDGDDFELRANVKKPLLLQGWFFFAGMVLMIIFGIVAVLLRQPTKERVREQGIVFWPPVVDGPVAEGLRFYQLAETRPFTKGSAGSHETEPRIVSGRPTSDEMVRVHAKCMPMVSFYLVIGGADSDPLVSSKKDYGENMQLAYSRALMVGRRLSSELKSCPPESRPPVIAVPRGPETLPNSTSRTSQADDRTVRLYGVLQAKD